MNRKNIILAIDRKATPTPPRRGRTQSLPEPKKERSHRGSQTSSQGTIFQKITELIDTKAESAGSSSFGTKWDTKRTSSSSSNKSSQKTNDLGPKCPKCGAIRGAPGSNSRFKMRSSSSRAHNIYGFQPEVMSIIPSIEKVLKRAFEEQESQNGNQSIQSTSVEAGSSSVTQEPLSSMESLFRSYRSYMVESSEKVHYPYPTSSDLSSHREHHKITGRGTVESECEQDLLEEGEKERFYRRMMAMYGNYHAQMVDFTKRTAVEMRIRREKMFGRKRRH
ncbi:hypothetical protein KR074_012286 [Drosophila pseudoananassae]|nr:hypothetical protein KR074_012286 [Drosophila pseudoananassae]